MVARLAAEVGDLVKNAVLGALGLALMGFTLYVASIVLNLLLFGGASLIQHAWVWLFP